MRLLLARHGNTFSPGDPVVWVGSRQDPPLVAIGREQAKSLGEALDAASIRLTAAYSGPLQRVRSYLDLVLNQFTAPIPTIIDSRLNEIDYGDWSGLTNEQVAARFGADVLTAWDQHGQWPQPDQGAWPESEMQVIERVFSFTHDLITQYPHDATILLISSNGLLRYFLKLIPNEIRLQSTKMKTGNLSELRFSSSWHERSEQFLGSTILLDRTKNIQGSSSMGIYYWNITPQQWLAFEQESA